MLATKTAALRNVDRRTERLGDQMASLTVIWRFPVLRLVLELEPRCFPAGRYAPVGIDACSRPMP